MRGANLFWLLIGYCFSVLLKSSQGWIHITYLISRLTTWKVTECSRQQPFVHPPHRLLCLTAIESRQPFEFLRRKNITLISLICLMNEHMKQLEKSMILFSTIEMVWDRESHIRYITVVSILKYHLSAAFSHNHNRYCVTTSKECLSLFNRNLDEFVGRFITVDETWTHQNLQSSSSGFLKANWRWRRPRWVSSANKS